MKNRTDFRKSVHVETGVDSCLRYYRNYIISLTFCFGKKNNWLWKINEFEWSGRFELV